VAVVEAVSLVETTAMEALVVDLTLAAMMIAIMAVT
jgi:hypothetical protein